MSSGPLVRFNPPRETRTVCAFDAFTRNIARPSGKMQGYFASGIFNGLGLQSVGACPQHTAQPRAVRINVAFMNPPSQDGGRRLRPRLRLQSIRNPHFEARNRYNINDDSVSKPACKRIHAIESQFGADIPELTALLAG